MFNRNATTHTLITQYIESIGQTDCTDQLFSKGKAIFTKPRTFYRLTKMNSKYFVELWYSDSTSPRFYRIARLEYPNRVVADIMGRYHCKQISTKNGNQSQSHFSLPSCN